MSILILDLDADYRASIFEKETFYLLRDFGEIPPDIGQVSLVVRAYRYAAPI